MATENNTGLSPAAAAMHCGKYVVACLSLIVIFISVFGFLADHSEIIGATASNAAASLAALITRNGTSFWIPHIAAITFAAMFAWAACVAWHLPEKACSIKIGAIFAAALAAIAFAGCFIVARSTYSVVDKLDPYQAIATAIIHCCAWSPVAAFWLFIAFSMMYAGPTK